MTKKDLFYAIKIETENHKTQSCSEAILARGRRVARPPFTLAKKFNVFIPLFFSLARKNIFFYIAKCQSVVCVILFSSAIGL